MASTERLITEIVGVEYYDGYENKPYQRNHREQFFYDDQKRLDRWISTWNDGGHDLEFFYESEDHISIFGDKWSGDRREAIVAEIDLDAAGHAVRIINGDESYTFHYSNGRVSQRNDWQGYTTTYSWSRDDLTAIGVSPSPYPQYEPYRESCNYGDMQNRTNLDLNYLAYGTEYFTVFANSVGTMLGLAGFFGSSAHYVTGNYLDPTGRGVKIDIRWTFDGQGFPVAYTWDVRNMATPKGDTGWKYTIYYDD